MNPARSTSNQVNCIYPVILSVPEDIKGLKGRHKVIQLSRFARRALEISAAKAHVRLGKLLKDENGVPLPEAGNFWSVTHKPSYVGAVIASKATGIDLEEIKDVSSAMFRKVASKREWSLCGSDSALSFFRVWTAKEAVLKAAGVGMKGLSHCEIRRVIDDGRMEVDYTGNLFFIEQLRFQGHIASVVDNGWGVQWTVI